MSRPIVTLVEPDLDLKDKFIVTLYLNGPAFELDWPSTFRFGTWLQIWIQAFPPLVSVELKWAVIRRLNDEALYSVINTNESHMPMHSLFCGLK